MTVEKSFTIYNQPAEASEQYARIRDLYEGMKADGLASIDGRLETSFARHAQVINTDLVVPHIHQLLGLNVRISLARFPKLVGWKERRDFSGSGTPSLGSDEERHGLKHRIEETGEEAGAKLIRAIELTIDDREMRRRVQSTMAGLCAA